MSNKTISLNLKCFGENREKVVGWMKTWKIMNNIFQTDFY